MSRQFPVFLSSRTQHDDLVSDESLTSNTSIPSLTLYQMSHCALPKVTWDNLYIVDTNCNCFWEIQLMQCLWWFSLLFAIYEWQYSKTCVKQPLSKRPKIGFQDQLSLNAGQKYCRMLQGEHSAILSTFIRLPFVIKIFVLSFFEWPFYTGFIVLLTGLLNIKTHFVYVSRKMSINLQMHQEIKWDGHSLPLLLLYLQG